MNHQFSVIIDHRPISNDNILDLADVLGNAKCLDASIGGHKEGAEVMFHREAESLDAAIKSAVAAIEGAGYRVKRIEMGRETISFES